MTRDSTAVPPAGEPPEPGSTTTLPDPGLEAVKVPVPMSNGEVLADADAAAPVAPSDAFSPDVLGASAEADAAVSAAPGGEATTAGLATPVATATHPPDIDPAKLDPDAMKVVFRLRQHGHEAYLVGGCVRDLLLGIQPKDFDVATSAHPGEVRAIFRNCRLIGRRFRLAHVYFKGGKIIEVATFRANPTDVEDTNALTEVAEASEPADVEGVEGEEERRPEPSEDDLLITHDNVFGTAEQDARRRDFRMNGLFYDVEHGEVIDYVRGLRDIQQRLIRTIGDPEVRMREDPVRILRAVRFACKLGLDIESRTYAAMEGAVEDLPRCAPPRLLEETFRLIRGGISTDALKLIDALGALKILLPPVAEFFLEKGKEGEEEFYAFTRALDRRVKSGPPLEDAILLAAMLYPLARSQPVPEESPDQPGRPTVARIVEDLLEELVKNSRLPRRIAERCRMLLIAQRTLTGERKRRGSLASFRRHPLFAESLVVFEILVDATGGHREALEKWKEGGAPEPVPGAEGAASGRPRRRRRRGGAGRRGAAGEVGEGGGDGASAGAETGPSADE